MRFFWISEEVPFRTQFTVAQRHFKRVKLSNSSYLKVKFSTSVGFAAQGKFPAISSRGAPRVLRSSLCPTPHARSAAFGSARNKQPRTPDTQCEDASKIMRILRNARRVRPAAALWYFSESERKARSIGLARNTSVSSVVLEYLGNAGSNAMRVGARQKSDSLSPLTLRSIRFRWSRGGC